MKEAYNDISTSADISPVTWKFSGQENDKGAGKEGGMIGNRREGRTDSLEPPDESGGSGVYHGPDRPACLVFPKTWDTEGSLTRPRVTGSGTDESGLDRVGRPACGPMCFDGSPPSASSNNGCETHPPLEGPGTLSPSEIGNPEAARRGSSDRITPWLGARNSS